MQIVSYIAIFLVGVVLGLVYFGSLWWTVAALTSQRFSGWFLALSFVVRLTLLTLVLYFVLLVSVWHLVVCLVGVVVARIVLVRHTVQEGSALAK